MAREHTLAEPKLKVTNDAQYDPQPVSIPSINLLHLRVSKI